MKKSSQVVEKLYDFRHFCCCVLINLSKYFVRDRILPIRLLFSLLPPKYNKLFNLFGKPLK